MPSSKSDGCGDLVVLATRGPGQGATRVEPPATRNSRHVKGTSCNKGSRKDPRASTSRRTSASSASSCARRCCNALMLASRRLRSVATRSSSSMRARFCCSKRCRASPTIRSSSSLSCRSSASTCSSMFGPGSRARACARRRSSSRVSSSWRWRSARRSRMRAISATWRSCCRRLSAVHGRLKGAMGSSRMKYWPLMAQNGRQQGGTVVTPTSLNAVQTAPPSTPDIGMNWP
mmetsp:Transcript_21538/g.61644  ORF Transcript_21538/g.61644 Transcript_21538/m.61644 type:complete len:232 (+) Transcript_21538:1-696(+)